MKIRAKAALILAALFLAACSPIPMHLGSPDLTDGAPIARTFYHTRCGGENVAPALSWSEVSGASSYSITMIDRSVRPANWSHWIVVNVPATILDLPRGGALPAGASEVLSNFGDAAYDGPCPPSGTGVHFYEITVYALPAPAPTLPPDADAAQLARTLSAIALAKASITVTAEAAS